MVVYWSALLPAKGLIPSHQINIFLFFSPFSLNTSTPEYDYILHRKETTSDGGIMVSIAAFQAVDPGSIPGRRNVLNFIFGKNETKKFLSMP